MGSGYEVDLSYLQDTLKKLQGVADGLDDANSKATYQTNLTRGQIGNEHFAEAGALFEAHETMKNELTSMIGTLKTMIQEFQTKTGHAHAAYSGHETQTSTTFNQGMS